MVFLRLTSSVVKLYLFFLIGLVGFSPVVLVVLVVCFALFWFLPLVFFLRVFPFGFNYGFDHGFL